MNDLESIEKLSKQLSRTNVYDQLLSRLESLKGEQIRISITGGSNVGKSSLVNVLTGSNLEVTSLPTNTHTNH